MNVVNTRADVVVIGAGIAGLSAALAAAERNARHVVLLDRATAAQAGGNTRWTSAYYRLDDVYDLGERFVEDVLAFSNDRTPRWYAERLAEQLPEAMDWVQSHGVRFRPASTYFITSARQRLQPVGGGETLVIKLTEAAIRHGVEIRYETLANGLLTAADGTVVGVEAIHNGTPVRVNADAVVIASGGFEGSPAAMRDAFGAKGPELQPIAPGGRFNTGEGIRMAIAVGAATSGQWDNFHAEPVDPRSPDAEALVMTFPYGILVNRQGQRFLDEGRGTVDETYEAVARTIWRDQGGLAYLIADQTHASISDWHRGVLTSVKPVTAGSIEELASALGVPSGALQRTVAEFNAATGAGEFDWRAPDHKATVGVDPPKSNWAVPIDTPPFIAYPITCSIVFTFGGLETDKFGRVLRVNGTAIPGLYAAGECTGIYFGKYPGGTSVMRGMVFGRLAGHHAAHLHDNVAGSSATANSKDGATEAA